MTDRTGKAGVLEGFLERRGDRAAEVVWEAALAMLARAVLEARECSSSRWRHYPSGDLRRLRTDLADGLRLARIAVAFQDAENESRRDLDDELRVAAAESGRRARRAQTLPAERARLANVEARRARAG